MLQMYVYTYLISDLEKVSQIFIYYWIIPHPYNPNPFKYPIHKHLNNNINGMKPKIYEILGSLEQTYWSWCNDVYACLPVAA